jgi:intein/homing endonuclease
MVDTINKKRQTDEIRRCARDPLYFFNSYVKISHPIKGPLPFNTFDFQNECVKAFIEHRFVIVNKSRQLGLSTLAAAYAAWLLLFHRNKEVIIMATKLSVAQNFIKKVKFCVKNLPKWLVLPKIEKDNDRSLVFAAPSNSRIEAIPTAADAGRSEALSLLIVDEAAHVSDFEELWKGLYPTLSCVVGGTKVLLNDGFHDIEELCGDYGVGEYFPLKGLIYGKNGLEPLSHGYVSPDGDTLKITTRHGLQLEVTHDHPLWKLDSREGGKMTPAKELKEGDCLRVQHSMQIFGDDDFIGHPMLDRITPKFAYLLGGYIAEGWISRGYRVTVSNSDDEFRDAYLNNDVIKPFVAAQNRKLICYSKEMVELFELIGINPAWKCDTKRVPKKIWRCSKEVQAAFLRGYFDGDGCASGMVSATSTSHKLLTDIHQLLLNFGFFPNLKRIKQEKLDRVIGTYIGENKNPVKSVRPAWCLEIPRSQGNMFLHEIGFNITRKADALKETMGRLVSNGKFIASVPLSGGIRERLEMIRVESGKAWGWFSANGVNMLGKHQKLVTRCTLKSFRDLLVKQNLVSERNLTFLDELCGELFCWDPIVKVERSNGRTYDFTVPGTHSFIQNCLLGSNTGGRALIISTPKGVGNWFHKLWVDAENKTNELYPIQLPWTSHPEHDEKWFAEQSVNMSSKAVAQELLCDFLSSGDTYIDAEDIQWVGTCVRDPIRREGFDRNVWIWVDPIKDSHVKYIISADVGRGDADTSAFHVLCTMSGEVVAEFKGRIRPDYFAKLLMEYGRKYNNALICPERNTYGNHVIIELINNKYTNIYFENHKGVYIGDYIPPEKIADAGFDTQRDSRKKIITKLEEVIRNKQIKVFSIRLWNELKTFVTQNDKPQALRNCSDDLVMALAIGVYLFDTSGVHSQFADQLNKAMVAGFGVSVNQFNNMAGTGNEVIPQWTGMIPYVGSQTAIPSTKRLRPKGDNPTDIDWLFDSNFSIDDC